jgi:hypothetical protein
MATVKLQGNYTLKLDGLYSTTYEQAFDGDKWDTIIKTGRSKYQIGKQAILISENYVGTNPKKHNSKPHYYLSFDLDGVPGNSNPSIKRSEGWRGTTNNLSRYAHGVVTIKSIRILKNGQVALTVK